MKRKFGRTNHTASMAVTDAIDASMTLDNAVDEFILGKQAQRSAERTIRDYKTHFRYLKQWLCTNYTDIRLSQITTKILHEYISYMTNEKIRYDNHTKKYKPGVVGLSPMTVNVRIRTMRSFFNWCYREGHIRINVAAGLRLQKVDDDRIMAFTSKQVRKLLDIPDQKSFVGFRDYVIMLILLDTGLRLNELFSLTKNDIDFNELMLTVPWEKAKTRKTRQVPISKSVARLLAELMKENEDFGPNSKKLFYSSLGTEYSPETFDKRLRECGRQARLEGVRVSAHTFRHTFAVQWIKNGGDPFSLQKILGHTDMTMVRKYVRLSDTDVKVKHNQYSPVHSFLRK